MSEETNKIKIDKEKTFSYIACVQNKVPKQLQQEIQKTALRLAQSGKDTMLVKWGAGIERMLIDSFLSLRRNYPNLRIVKVVFWEDECRKELT